jgi:fructose transport system substrate-binding protein
MKEGAAEAAAKAGRQAADRRRQADGDNAGQVTAMENMIAAGAKTILITPSDSKAIMPAIKKAQRQGRAGDRAGQPDRPRRGTDALFATDNYKAGVLIGQYAKAALAASRPRSPRWTCSPATRWVRSATTAS